MSNYDILNNLKTAKTVCLLGHETPDADALCSMVVFKNFLKSKFNLTKIDMFAEASTLSHSCLQILDTETINPTPLDNYDYTITLDTSNPKLLGKYKYLLEIATHTIAIDHHATNLQYAENNIVEVCSSTCELVFKILNYFDYEFSNEDYGKIYGGILTDTGNLTVGAITEETFKTAGACYSHCKGQEIYSLFFNNNSIKTQHIFAKAIQNSKSYEDERILISYITPEEAKHLNACHDDYIGIVNRLAQTKNTELVSFIYPKDDYLYVSLRVKKGYDAATIAKRNGGGGHLGAAAFESYDSIENIINLVLNEFNNEIKSKKLNFSKNPFKN